MQVKLDDILERIDLKSEESKAYLNLEIGKVVYVSHKALLIAEDGDDYDDLPE